MGVMMRGVAVLLTVFGLGIGVAQAAVPAALNYQGFLSDANTGASVEAPAGSPLAVTFKLYDAATGGNLVYAETQSVTVTHGTYNVLIGTGTVVNPPNVAFDAVAFDQPYWLETTVGAGASAQTLAPRQPLVSSPYARRAASLDAGAPVPAGQITGTLDLTTLPATQQLPAPACAASQVAQWDGSAWTCASAAMLDASGNLLVGGRIAAGGANFTSNLLGPSTISSVNTNGHAVRGASANTIAVLGVTGSTNPGDWGAAAGVFGYSPSGFGTGGRSDSGSGVSGSSASGIGVYGISYSGDGVVGESSSGYAGNFRGNVIASGALDFGSTTRQMVNLWGSGTNTYGIGVQPATEYFRVDSSTGAGGFAWYRGGAHSDATFDPGTGGGTLMTLDRSGNLNAANQVRGNNTTGIAVYGVNISTDLPAVEGWNQGTGDLLRGWSGVSGSQQLKFRVYNNGSTWIAGTLTQASDARLKTDVEPLPDVLDQVEKLRGVSYVMKDDPNGTRHVGVIAQDVERAYPELVSTDERGMKAVAYGNLTAVLIEAVKALKAEGDAKDHEIARIREHEAALEARASTLAATASRVDALEHELSLIKSTLGLR